MDLKVVIQDDGNQVMDIEKDTNNNVHTAFNKIIR